MLTKLFYLQLNEALFLKPFEIDVDEVFLIGEHMPYGDKDFTGNCHLYFHFTFLLYGYLHIAEVGKEAVSGS